MASGDRKGTPATALLHRHRIAHAVYPYQVPATTPDYGRAVAAALGVPPEQVFKTLVTQIRRAEAGPAGPALTVAIVPVTGDLDLKALAAAVGGKRAAVADRDDAERATGYVRGGISPLGQRQRLPTVLDRSAVGLERIFVSAGRRGLQVALDPADLIRLTGARLAPIARPPG